MSMSENNINQILQFLESVQKVEAPNDLYSKIENKLKQKPAQLSKQQGYSLLLAFIFLFVLNILVISKSFSGKHENTNLAQTFQLITNNNLYQ